jgi:fructosamine-3-kinase
MFEAEVEGLRELALASAIRVPAVIDCGIEDGTAFIALERLHFEPATRPCWASSWLCCTGTPRSGTAGIVTIRSV